VLSRGKTLAGELWLELPGAEPLEETHTGAFWAMCLPSHPDPGWVTQREIEGTLKGGEEVHFRIVKSGPDLIDYFWEEFPFLCQQFLSGQ